MQIHLPKLRKQLGLCTLLAAASALCNTAAAEPAGPSADLYSGASGGVDWTQVQGAPLDWSTSSFNETYGSTVASTEYGANGISYGAAASASYGFNQARAWATTLDGTGTRPYSWAGAVSSWSDAFVITGGTGLGVANLSALLQGTIAPASSGYAGFAVLYIPFDSYGADGISAHQDQVILSWDGNSDTQSGAHNESLAGSFAFEYGTRFRLIGSLQVEADQGGFVDFSGNATVTEIAVPYLSSINATSGYQGYNIIQTPVPEPSKMMMLGIGLLALGARLKSRKHKRLDTLG